MKRFILFSPYLLQIILIPKFMGEDLLNSLLEEARNVKDKFQIIQWHTATRPTYKGGILSTTTTTTTTKKKKKNHTKRPNTARKWNTIKLHYINQLHPESSSNSLSEREKPKCLSMVSFFLFKKLSLVYPVHSFIGLNMLLTLLCCFC